MGQYIVSTMWFIWKHWKLSAVVTYVILLALLLLLNWWWIGLGSLSDINILKICLEILEFWDKKLPTGHPKIYFGISLFLTFLFPALVTLFGGCLFKYFLLPRNKTQLLAEIGMSGAERAELGRRRLTRAMSEVADWIKRLPNGCPVTPDECTSLSIDIVGISSATQLFATCLQTPQDLYDNLKPYSEYLIEEISKEKKKLVRILVAEPEILDLDRQELNDRRKIKWFVNLHKRDNFDLRLIKMDDFIFRVNAKRMESSKLDIILFDRRFFFALETNVNTHRVIKKNNRYNLFLVDRKDKVGACEEFIQALIEGSGSIRDYIDKKEWTTLYD